MIAANSSVKVNSGIAYTKWFIKEIKFFGANGATCNGTVSLIEVPSGDRNVFRWYGSYNGGIWAVSGDGARLRAGTKVPDPSSFPFSLDVYVNQGIKNFVASWLSQNVDKPRVSSSVHVPDKVEANANLKPVVSASKLELIPSAELPVPKPREIVKAERDPAAQHIISITPPTPPPLQCTATTPVVERVRRISGREKIMKVGSEKSMEDKYFDAIISVSNGSGRHSVQDRSNALHKQFEAGKTLDELSSAIGKGSNTTVVNYLALQRLHPSLKPLLDRPTPTEDRIPIIHGTVLARIVPEKQVEIWSEARREPNNTLVLAKIHQLGKPHFVCLRKKNRRSGPKRTSAKVVRRFERIEAALIELDSILGGGSIGAVRVLGHEDSLATLTRLDEFARKISKVKASLESALASQEKAQ